VSGVCVGPFMLVCWAAVAVGALYPALGKSRVVPYCAMVLWLVGVASTIAARACLTVASAGSRSVGEQFAHQLGRPSYNRGVARSKPVWASHGRRAGNSRARHRKVGKRLTYGRAAGRGTAGRARAYGGFGEIVVRGVGMRPAFEDGGLDVRIEGTGASGGSEG